MCDFFLTQSLRLQDFFKGCFEVVLVVRWNCLNKSDSTGVQKGWASRPLGQCPKGQEGKRVRWLGSHGCKRFREVILLKSVFYQKRFLSSCPQGPQDSWQEEGSRVVLEQSEEEPQGIVHPSSSLLSSYLSNTRRYGPLQLLVILAMFLGDSKSWRASKSPHWFKSYGNFWEWAILPSGGVASGRVCACSLRIRLVFRYNRLDRCISSNRIFTEKGLKALTKEDCIY